MNFAGWLAGWLFCFVDLLTCSLASFISGSFFYSGQAIDSLVGSCYWVGLGWKVHGLFA